MDYDPKNSARSTDKRSDYRIMKAMPATAQSFKRQLQAYKQRIDSDIAAYSQSVQAATHQNFTAASDLATEVFLDILSRGGKRVRGALVMVGVDLVGGDTTQPAVLEAARVLEMLHAYILIIDDIQDRSPSRRGGPTAHTKIAEYHRQHQLAGQADHFGVAIALNAALEGAHLAQQLLCDLPCSAERRLAVSRLINQTMVVTAHGQTNDIFNEVVPVVTATDIDHVLEWKTAHYTFLNPLMVGMTLAGANEATCQAIHEYAMHAGRAFQITDDVLGVFGNEFDSGKSPLDDIKEGKRTVLTVYALEHAAASDRQFLQQQLGNEALTPADFERCKAILQTCGAADYARQQAEAHVTAAQAALQAAAKTHQWQSGAVEFLDGLVAYLPQRQA